jgi:two-component system cell cycle sensor histidine kinase/response regulator CckA
MFAGTIAGKGGLETLSIGDLAGLDDRDRLLAAWKAANDGQVNVAPVDVLVDGETNRFMRFFISPVVDDEALGPEDDRVIVYALDMTEQRALQEQIAQSQKMQAVGTLAGGLAHDFNNVLTGIIGFSEMLVLNHRPSDRAFQDIMQIKHNANRAASLVRQLMAFSRRQTLRPQVIQLGEALSDLRMLLSRLLGEKVKLQLVHGRDVWPVKTDLSQFEQVVINLTVNARDAMPEGGQLTIRTLNVPAAELASRYAYKEMPAQDYVLVEVEDEGTGMSAEVMRKIFEPFFSTKEVGKGTGLGLSTVYGIIKQTGGFIYPESELGKGTVFRLFLPRYVVEAGEQAEGDTRKGTETPEKPRDITGNETLLLVEDEDAVRTIAHRALTDRGYTVMEASTGAEALEIYREHDGKFDLVISDVVMPEMDGPTLFRQLRKERPDLRFIFMSGHAEDAFAKNLPDNADQEFAFLPKPFSLKQLATAVKDALER